MVLPYSERVWKPASLLLVRNNPINFMFRSQWRRKLCLFFWLKDSVSISEVLVAFSTSYEHPYPQEKKTKQNKKQLVWGSSVLFTHRLKCYQVFLNFFLCLKADCFNHHFLISPPFLLTL